MKFSNIHPKGDWIPGNTGIPISTFILAICLSFMINTEGKAQEVDDMPGSITLVIHGGAGTIRRSDLSEEMERAYRDKLKEALDTGYVILEEGGSAMEAVVATIRIMEDSPLFNAGKGAVFTHEGKNEMDASVMDGESLKAGAVAGVTVTRNPITAAWAVMEKSPHVMMSGPGAEAFAREQGLELVDPDYFYTERRYRQLERIRGKEPRGDSNFSAYPDHKFGTVGVAALDQFGNLAAGTSTGGMTNKKYGRIGDSPVIGAGTYADNKTCAVSSTGHGEYFIRKVVAFDIAARMKYGGRSLKEAAYETIHEELTGMGGTGGVICLDRQGNIAMEFNTEGMYRGYRRKGEEARVFIYR